MFGRKSASIDWDPPASPTAGEQSESRRMFEPAEDSLVDAGRYVLLPHIRHKRRKASGSATLHAAVARPGSLSSPHEEDSVAAAWQASV